MFRRESLRKKCKLILQANRHSRPNSDLNVSIIINNAETAQISVIFCILLSSFKLNLCSCMLIQLVDYERSIALSAKLLVTAVYCMLFRIFYSFKQYSKLFSHTANKEWQSNIEALCLRPTFVPIFKFVGLKIEARNSFYRSTSETL